MVAPWRRRILIALAVAIVMAVTAGVAVVWRHERSGQGLAIGATERHDISAPWPSGSPRPAPDGGPPFVWSVSDDGRHFLDQHGRPILIKGDSPWSMMTDLSPAQAEGWFADRQRLGFNAAIVSLIGAQDNGSPDDLGTTFDGIRPFVDEDVLRWNEAYFDRAESYLEFAAEHGITVFLYPIDGWVVDKSFKPTSVEQCRDYGAAVARRFAHLPNIMWMSGGDYFPRTNEPELGSDVDHCIDSMMYGIRSTGDDRPFSIQLGYQKSISSDNPYWATRVSWNFVYTYYPTYKAVLEAYGRTPTKPALYGEANYENLNLQADTPATTNETLRRQVCWAMTSGSPGNFYGTADWKFEPGWESRLDSEAVGQISRLNAFFAGLPWTELVPDTSSRLLTGGRGTEVTDDRPLDVLQNDFATAAATPDGRHAVIYVPTPREVTLDVSRLAPGTRAWWVDPSTGVRQEVALSSRYAAQPPNADGNGDWLLLLGP